MSVNPLSDVPAEVIGGVANLPDLMIAFARSEGIQRSDADHIVNLVPAGLRSAPCFLDRLTAIWCYIYGRPFTGLADNQITWGTHMYQEVERLFEIISCPQQRLTPAILSRYLNALSDPSRHEDTLVEFAPILRLDANGKYAIQYEVPGAGESTIDWLIRGPDGIDLLMEVKNRVGDLVEGLSQLHLHSTAGGGGSPEPTHDSDLLFKSVANKFPSRTPRDAVQAVWIKTYVKQEEAELRSAFEKLDATRVHVAILGDWEDDVYILANDDRVKQSVIRIFRLVESRRFVFKRGVPVNQPNAAPNPEPPAHDQP